VGGFLQVAVSEAPPEDSPTAHDCVAGAPDTALRHIITNPRPDRRPEYLVPNQFQRVIEIC